MMDKNRLQPPGREDDINPRHPLFQFLKRDGELVGEYRERLVESIDYLNAALEQTERNRRIKVNFFREQKDKRRKNARQISKDAIEDLNMADRFFDDWNNNHLDRGEPGDPVYSYTEESKPIIVLREGRRSGSK